MSVSSKNACVYIRVSSEPLYSCHIKVRNATTKGSRRPDEPGPARIAKVRREIAIRRSPAALGPVADDDRPRRWSAVDRRRGSSPRTRTASARGRWCWRIATSRKPLRPLRREIAASSHGKATRTSVYVLNQKKSSVPPRSRKSGLDGRPTSGVVTTRMATTSSSTPSDRPRLPRQIFSAVYVSRMHPQFFVPNGGNNGW